MSPAALSSGPSDVASAMKRWNLVSDGAPFATASSLLAPVRRADGAPAMLKRALVAEEVRGNRVMVWWSGTAVSAGCAAVLEHDDATILLERALGTRSLTELAEGIDDDSATRILCQTIARLHSVALPAHAGAPGAPDEPDASSTVSALPTLTEWFADLLSRGDQHGGFLDRAAADARRLLADQRRSVVLHGDIHHGNVLDFGARGWLAIDPKGIVGDPIFDYLNLFCNPTPAVAVRPGRLARQVEVVADASGHDPETLLRWLRAWCALSATWFELDGLPAEPVLAVGAEAERLLGR